MTKNKPYNPSEEPQVEEMDLKGLEPPQPMVRIMAALEESPKGHHLRALLDRKPVYLIPLIEEAGHSYTISQRDPETWVLLITKA